jgi:hypothetical protein
MVLTLSLGLVLGLHYNDDCRLRRLLTSYRIIGGNRCCLINFELDDRRLQYQSDRKHRFIHELKQLNHQLKNRPFTENEQRE